MRTRASAIVIKRCREIISEIDKAIPTRGYVKPVQDAFEEKGLDVPTRRKIIAVRNGNEYDLGIAKALREISQDIDENDELIEPPKWEADPQTSIFEQKVDHVSKSGVTTPKKKRAVAGTPVHRSRGKKVGV